jgi:hypothetical protein
LGLWQWKCIHRLRRNDMMCGVVLDLPVALLLLLLLLLLRDGCSN